MNFSGACGDTVHKFRMLKLIQKRLLQNNETELYEWTLIK